MSRNGWLGVLAGVAVAAVVATLIFALRATAPDGHAAAAPVSAPSGPAPAVRRAPPRTTLAPPSPAPKATAIGKPAASASPGDGPPADDAAFVQWLLARSEAELRSTLVDLVSRAPGTYLATVNCNEPPCQSNVHAKSPEAFNTFLELAHHEFRGHIAVVASVDHPAAPARVVGSIVIGTPDRQELPVLGSGWVPTPAP